MTFSYRVQSLLVLTFFSITIVRAQDKYAIRMINAYSSPEVEKTFVLNGTTLFLEGPSQYLNCSFYFFGKHTLKKVDVNIKTCNQQGYSCQYFMKWNFPTICPVLKMKNQIWTPLMDAIHPTLTCNLQKKYDVIKATLDAKQLIAFHKDAPKHYFKIEVTGYNPKNVKIAIYNIEFSVFTYKPSKKS